MMYNSPYVEFLFSLSFFSIFLSFIIGLLRIKYFEKSDYLFFILIFIGIVTELASSICSWYFKQPNSFILNIYEIIETLMVFYFYCILFNISKKKILISVFLFGIFCSVDFYINNGNRHYGNHMIIESLMAITFSLLTFQFPFSLRKFHITNIYQSNIFWYNSALFIYFTSCFFLSLFMNYMLENDMKLFFYAWGICHSIANIILNMLIAIGFWKSKHQTAFKTLTN